MSSLLNHQDINKHEKKLTLSPGPSSAQIELSLSLDFFTVVYPKFLWTMKLVVNGASFVLASYLPQCKALLNLFKGTSEALCFLRRTRAPSCTCFSGWLSRLAMHLDFGGCTGPCILHSPHLLEHQLHLDLFSVRTSLFSP